MSLLTAPNEHLHRASWSRRDQRTEDRTRALLGQIARFTLVLTGASGLLTLLVILKTAAYMSHHPM
ncbi:hypothetical protein SSBR45G_63680 [Bradyrhizobium sp. SSBR45G]|uniref:hypothetical protein n=1 Tax=unclassified Bradyrhizobium TaxID=2631580 RepID=UPI002342BA1E|nr:MULTISPECIES: hypothetical protein [unclassified Bradyrhizobium]GLH81459.1 hypothetical protein SSBR45G_63680 [Bradyrhizobium sp. SSBR45G]GLH88866.1 hypothetical protein SSBR45R_63270 [Bradyrhizobium sp. SSBR45R]